MKKYYYALSFLIGLFCSLGMSAQNTDFGASFSYEVISKDNKTVKITSATVNKKDVIVPSMVTMSDGITYRITEIGDAAFQKRDLLETVVMGNNIEDIAKNAFFNCSNLRSIDFKNTRTIGDYAFKFCRNLETLQSDYLTTISPRTFLECSGLISIDFPNIEEIGQEAFQNCTKLASINLSDAPKLSLRTFDNTPWLKAQPNGMVYLKNTLYLYKGKMPNNAKLEVKDETKKIAAWAFNAQKTLLSINIKNVDYLGINAFNTCNKLTSITTWETTPPTVDTKIASTTITEQINLYIPVGTTAKYKAAAVWGSCKSRNEFDAPVQKIVCHLTDGQDYANQVATQYDEIHYTRNFNHDDFHALFLPYSLKYEEWKDNFEIYRLNNIHQYDTDKDGEIDETMVEIIRLNGGMTKPNKPYLIRPKKTGEQKIISLNVTLQPTIENSITCCSFTSNFTFTGTYKRYSGIGHYVMLNGSLHPAASTNSGPGAFRWYLTITARDGFSQYAPKRVLFYEQSNETTGVEKISPSERSFDIYNLNGQLVRKAAKTTEGLPKGIYVINGRKVIR